MVTHLVTQGRLAARHSRHRPGDRTYRLSRRRGSWADSNPLCSDRCHDDAIKLRGPLQSRGSDTNTELAAGRSGLIAVSSLRLHLGRQSIVRVETRSRTNLPMRSIAAWASGILSANIWKT